MSSNYSDIKMSFPTVGFENLGNTCFLNSVLQALRHCPPLIKYFHTYDSDSLPIRSESKKIEILKEFHSLIHACSSDKCIRPIPFVNALIKTLHECDDDWWAPRQQADAAECMQYIIDAIHDASYRRVRIRIEGEPRTKDEMSHMKAMESWSTFFSKEYSPIVENMYGQTQSKITCNECNTVSERYEPWLMMKLPIPGGDTPGSRVPTMTDCINAAFASETIQEYVCDTCKKRTDATIQTRIARLPTLLILSFKRFTNTGSKISGQIDWDLNHLDFTRWMAFSRNPYVDSAKKPIYETFSVIEHMGSSRSGHYRMFAKSNEGWKEYDDCSVRKVDESSVISPSSYILLLTLVEMKKRMADMHT